MTKKRDAAVGLTAVPRLRQDARSRYAHQDPAGRTVCDDDKMHREKNYSNPRPHAGAIIIEKGVRLLALVRVAGRPACLPVFVLTPPPAVSFFRCLVLEPPNKAKLMSSS